MIKSKVCCFLDTVYIFRVGQKLTAIRLTAHIFKMPQPICTI